MNNIKRPGKLERKYNTFGKLVWVWLVLFILTLIFPIPILKVIRYTVLLITAFLFYSCVMDIIEYHIKLERYEAQQDEEEATRSKVNDLNP